MGCPIEVASLHAQLSAKNNELAELKRTLKDQLEQVCNAPYSSTKHRNYN